MAPLMLRIGLVCLWRFFALTFTLANYCSVFISFILRRKPDCFPVFIIYSYNGYLLYCHLRKNSFPVTCRQTMPSGYVILNKAYLSIRGVEPTPFDEYLNPTFYRQHTSLITSQIGLFYALARQFLKLKTIVFYVPHLKPMGFSNVSHMLAFLPLKWILFYDDGLSGSIQASSTRQYIPDTSFISISWDYIHTSQRYHSKGKNLVSAQYPSIKNTQITPSYAVFSNNRLAINYTLYRRSSSSSTLVVCILDSKYFDSTILLSALNNLAQEAYVYHYIHPVHSKRMNLNALNVSINKYIRLYQRLSVIPEEHILFLLSSGFHVRLYSAYSSVPFFVLSILRSAPPRFSSQLTLIPLFHEPAVSQCSLEIRQAKQLLQKLLN
jgi:hypothetical protein